MLHSLRNSFTGCVRDVTINNNSLDLLGHAPSMLGNDPPTAQPGCGRDETCLTSSMAGVTGSAHLCSNGGTCVSEWAGPRCQCADAFSGPECADCE